MVNKILSLDMLRHGMTSAGQCYIGSTDSELTEQGWLQMSETVADRCWPVIISSPLRRCREFAEHLANKTSADLVVMEQFQEYHFGVMEGLTAIEVMEQYPGTLERFWQDPMKYPPESAESLSDFGKRILSGIELLYQEYADLPVLLVCHGGVIKALRCYSTGQPLTELMKISAVHGSLHSLTVSDKFFHNR